MDTRIDKEREEKGVGGSWRYIHRKCDYCGKCFQIGRERYSRQWGIRDSYLFPRESCPRKCDDMIWRSIQIANALGPDWEIYITHLKKLFNEKAIPV